jgi:hypothetical protein
MATTKTTTRLPVGAKVLRRGPRTRSITLAEELARKGGSDALVRAIGGEKAVIRVRRTSANGKR